MDRVTEKFRYDVAVNKHAPNPNPVASHVTLRRTTHWHPTVQRLFKFLFFILMAGALYFQWFSIPFCTDAPVILSLPKPASQDPGANWKDDVWPIRQPKQWDISTDFPYPRTLEYDVQEGTWLRLDVHPKTGDIIFDMAGDIFCISNSHSTTVARAHPILLGVPHDSDPHFSPEGDRIVFRSDAELGVENIWIMKWTGCEDMDLRPTTGRNALLTDALKSKTIEDDLLASGVKESPERKQRRLIREGRLGGAFPLVIICGELICVHNECSSACYKRDLPLALRCPIPSFRFQNYCNKMVHFGA
jgi:hypothetical protein